MIKLINGRGQLGTALGKIIEREKIETKEEIIIYHTWNIQDKSENIQKECYEAFRKFVDENLNCKIIFISTYSQTENFYNYYKQLAEVYLLSKNQKGYVIRLPTLIGKGICEKFRNNESDAFGEMEIMSIEEASQRILDFALSNSLIKNIRIYGTQIPAEIAKELILFGKYGTEK